jgi:HD-GYP domain-containing protein (c-di-GMP phosphodiesterase class II)
MTLKSPQSSDLISQLCHKKYLKKYLSTLKKCDRDSLEHSLRVGAIAIDIGQQNHLSKKDIVLLGTAGLLHDLGKCDIPKIILTKKSALTRDEREEIKKHPMYGFRRLKEKTFATTRKIVVAHHEFTPTPYPRKLPRQEKKLKQTTSGASLSFITQILAVADMFDALANQRSYKKAFAKTKVRHILRTQFTGERKLIEQALERF